MLELITEAAETAVDPALAQSYARMSFGRVGEWLLGRFAGESAGVTDYVLLIACALACVIVPYLLGSINFGIIVSKVLYREDIRTYGSGNAGATNMLRTYGKASAAITFIGDVLKCVLSVALGRVIFGLTGGYVALFCCIVGHAFPVFYKFRGGKGVAAAAGGVAAMYAFTPRWYVILIELAVFVIVVAFTRYISLGSVTAMFVYPLLMSRLELGWRINILLAFMIAAFIVWLHRGNIRRIYQGKESKLSFSHTDKHKKEEQ